MSPRDMTCGTAPEDVHGRGEGPHAAARRNTFSLCLPAWVIWVKTAAPSARTASTIRARTGSAAGAADRPPARPRLVPCTRSGSMTTSPTPPRARSAW